MDPAVFFMVSTSTIPGFTRTKTPTLTATATPPPTPTLLPFTSASYVYDGDPTPLHCGGTVAIWSRPLSMASSPIMLAPVTRPQMASLPNTTAPTLCAPVRAEHVPPLPTYSLTISAPPPSQQMPMGNSSLSCVTPLLAKFAMPTGIHQQTTDILAS